MADGDGDDDDGGKLPSVDHVFVGKRLVGKCVVGKCLAKQLPGINYLSFHSQLFDSGWKVGYYRSSLCLSEFLAHLY